MKMQRKTEYYIQSKEIPSRYQKNAKKNTSTRIYQNYVIQVYMLVSCTKVRPVPDFGSSSAQSHQIQGKQTIENVDPDVQ
jgi:hypothetical protein